jgi:hypothetical protein
MSQDAARVLRPFKQGEEGEGTTAEDSQQVAAARSQPPPQQQTSSSSSYHDPIFEEGWE